MICFSWNGWLLYDGRRVHINAYLNLPPTTMRTDVAMVDNPKHLICDRQYADHSSTHSDLRHCGCVHLLDE